MPNRSHPAGGPGSSARPAGMAALQEAINLFADHGYEGTSVDDLTDAMRMGRQSLYNKFGDKRQLYLAALRQYIDDQIEYMLNILGRPIGPYERIAELFDACLADLVSQDARRCLFSCAITEFGSSDKGVLGLTRSANMSLGRALARCLAQGQDEGVVTTSRDVAALADYLIWSMAGIRMAARFGASETTLSDLAAIALSAVRKDGNGARSAPQRH